MKLTKLLQIKGRVQGVGFRYSVSDEAKRRGLTGWVRNAYDGSVEAVLQGEEITVLNMLEWIKNGPGFSRVDSMEEMNVEGEYGDFEIRF